MAIELCAAIALLLLLSSPFLLLLSRLPLFLSRLPLPPGSFGLPFLGETLSYIGHRNTTFAVGTPSPFLSHRIQRYGRLFRTHLFGMPTIISADPDVNKLLLAEGKLVEFSYTNVARAILGDGALLFLHGDQHRRIRNIVWNFMNGTKIRSNFLDEAQDVALWTLKSWNTKGLVHAQVEAKKFGFNFMVLKLLSLLPGDPITESLMESLENVWRGVYSLPLNLLGTRYHRALKERSKIKKLIEAEMAKRQAQHCERTPKHSDFLDAILGDVDQHGQRVPQETVSDLILNLCLGGYESTPAIITVVVKLLTDHPDVLLELKAEHIAIRGTKSAYEKLSWEDYKSMHFTQHVINEALRLANPVNALQRKALQDIHIKGYVIPKGWKVWLSARAVSLDPDFFPDPLNFNPWRWKGDVNPSCFIPFGGGSRVCIGGELSRLETAMFLHYLVILYSWEATESDYALCFPQVKLAKDFPIRVRSLHG